METVGQVFAEERDKLRRVQVRARAAPLTHAWAAISAGLSGRRRGCRAVESPVSCRHPAWARAFRDLPLEEATVPRPSGPACRPAARPAGRSSFPPEPPCRNAALDASARNRRRVPAMAVRFGLEAWLGPAGPGRPPRQPLPSSHTRETVRALNPCRENGLRPRRFRDQMVAFFLFHAFS